MSAQELMKKHYIIQQEVFREKNDRPLPEPSNSEGASEACAETRLFVNRGRSSGWAIGAFRRPVKGVSSAIRSKHGRLVDDSFYRRSVKGGSLAVRPKHGRNVGDSFSHTAGKRRFIGDSS